MEDSWNSELESESGREKSQGMSVMKMGRGRMKERDVEVVVDKRTGGSESETLTPPLKPKVSEMKMQEVTNNMIGNGTVKGQQEK